MSFRPAKKQACCTHASMKDCAAFSAGVDIASGMLAGVSQWNNACITAANRRVCPLDFDNMPA